VNTHLLFELPIVKVLLFQFSIKKKLKKEGIPLGKGGYCSSTLLVISAQILGLVTFVSL